MGAELWRQFTGEVDKIYNLSMNKLDIGTNNH